MPLRMYTNMTGASDQGQITYFACELRGQKYSSQTVPPFLISLLNPESKLQCALILMPGNADVEPSAHVDTAISSLLII